MQKVALALISIFVFAGCSGDAEVLETTTTTTIAAAVVATTTTTTPAVTTTPATQPEQARNDEAQLLSHTSPLGFTMEYPRKWRVEEEVGGIVTFFSPTNGQDSFSEFVEVYTLDSDDLGLTDPTPAEVMQLLAADIVLSGEYGEMVIFQEGADTTDGEEAYGVAMQGTLDETVYTLAYAASIHNGTIYVIGFQATDEVNEYAADFRAMIDSFAFTN